MPLLFWDASALVKRYIAEVDSQTADAVFGAVPTGQMFGTVLGYAETFSVLLRRCNLGVISVAAFNLAKTSLREDIVNDLDFTLLTVDDAAIFAGITLMERYNVNASDSAILALFLRYIQALPAGSPSPILVASDQRLIAAARAEGLAALDPEVVAAADVSAFLSAL